MVEFDINIDEEIEKFNLKVEKDRRIILSAKFGDGKSHLLDLFRERYDDKYYFITIYPVNYVVEDNKDIFEFIKRDIIFQLLNDSKLKELDLTAICKSIVNKDSCNSLLDFISCCSIEGLALASLVKVALKIKDGYDERKVTGSKYVSSFINKTGSISEMDAYSALIKKTIEKIERGKKGKKTILLIEDLDRLDPAHLFRILNVLAAHIDNPYYKDIKNENKFGFSHIILVMDYYVTSYIFQHFYGKDANYEGYIKKFMDGTPFLFSIKEIATKLLLDKIVKDVGIKSDISSLKLSSRTKYEYTNLSELISGLSIRRIKEIMLVNYSDRIDSNKIVAKRGDRTLTANLPIVRLLFYLSLALFPQLSKIEILQSIIYGINKLDALYLFSPFMYLETGILRKVYRDEYSDYYSCTIDKESLNVVLEPLNATYYTEEVITSDSLNFTNLMPKYIESIINTIIT